MCPLLAYTADNSYRVALRVIISVNPAMLTDSVHVCWCPDNCF